MPFDMLLNELRSMFQHRQTKVIMRKRFEERSWKKDETFHKYCREKVIMGNRVTVDDDEMLEYVIDGIPDEALRNQARVQGFETVDTLLKAFEKVTIREHSSNKGEKKENRTNDNKKNAANVVIRCHNCGMRDYTGINCPTKEQGVKCFGCNERGHIASKYPKNLDLGEFQTEIVVDERSYPIRIRVVSDTLFQHPMLIGTDFLDTVEVNIKLGKVSAHCSLCIVPKIRCRKYLR
ncbi:hypothetical protein ALC57_00383 [Trachymyrmex cornetzi]|uniref:CCHC-type domain-containing protein n=1 Tax=Trachymyrmex cornetzi TaxID=471704 RepID=A0A151JS21_9HYME|nr:hypothetical protein ALC57_00383 [Trachymyrmex cornetzi]